MFAAALLSIALAGAVSAQESNMTLIPTGISTSCTSLLNEINSAQELTNCVQPLLNATASFNPVSNANLSSSDINWTLASMCKNNAGCSDSTIRSWLTKFYSACQSELTSNTAYNSQVRELYDILYVVNPLKGAVCSVDSSNQEYCVNEIVGVGANSTGPSSPSNTTTTTNGTSTTNTTAGNTTTTNMMITSFASTTGFDPVKIAAANLYIAYNSAAALSRRFLDLIPRQNSGNSQSTFATIITPNSTTYRQTNLPFLFLQPTFQSKNLCTPCTREIMVQYIKWETAVPYALGLAQSPILGGQIELWNAINNTCGQAYVAAINSQVGQFSGISNSTSAASSIYGSSASIGGGMGGIMVGLAAVGGVIAIFA